MKTLNQYINERFISKENYILIYPYGEFFKTLNIKYSENRFDSSNSCGCIFCIDASKEQEIIDIYNNLPNKTFEPCGYIFRCFDDFDKEKFKEQWDEGTIDLFGLKNYENTKQVYK